MIAEKQRTGRTWEKDTERGRSVKKNDGLSDPINLEAVGRQLEPKWRWR
jgi:hypothetical protein